MNELDKYELNRLCKICVDNGISTGHADTLAEFAGECVTNLLEMRIRLTITEAAYAVVAAAAAASEDEVTPWISVEDRLPEDAVHVFVKRRDRFCDRAELSSIYFDGLPAWYLPEGPTMAVGGNVTHWMHIPEIKETTNE